MYNYFRDELYRYFRQSEKERVRVHGVFLAHGECYACGLVQQTTGSVLEGTRNKRSMGHARPAGYAHYLSHAAQVPTYTIASYLSCTLYHRIQPV